MKESELPFDHNQHILYSKSAKRVILHALKTDYDAGTAAKLWEKFQNTYAAFLNDLPYCGGKANRQAAGIYDSIALIAYYDAVPDKPSLQQLEQMNNDIFVKPYQNLGRLGANLNWKSLLKLAYKAFSKVEENINAHAEDWTGNYQMELAPFDPQQGIYYRFTSCPIADFARSHGYLYLMPALCNADYPMLACIHATLIRNLTCAHGDYCDYRIIGDKSPLAAVHPLKQDEAGYLYND